MRFVVNDLAKEYQERVNQAFNKEDRIISNDGKIKKCIGCFGCWLKTPLKCCLKDEYANIVKEMEGLDEYIIITECFCGSYSVFVKNIFDRSISYMLPFFNVRGNEMHHIDRYSKKFKLTVYAYGKELTSNEKACMKKFVAATAISFNCTQYKLSFFESPEEVLVALEDQK